MAENKVNRILIAPDKFKYSLGAHEVCSAVEEGIRKIIPQAQITKIPLADGGEGSLAALESSIQFNRVHLEVKNPLFSSIKVYYGLLNETAYIEMAQASGLQLLNEKQRNPMYTTSFGTGEMILDALQKGVKKIYLFVGGSATNDAGMGIASALGHVFKDQFNNDLEPIGSNLIKVKSIVSTEVSSFDEIEVNILTDVNNPLFGENGAAYVYASQKGANEREIVELEKGLINFASLLQSTFNKEVSNIPGSGAAGGVGAGAVIFCNAKIKSGIDSILDLLNIDDYIQRNDIIITGEGFIDNQTLEGKVVMGVMKRCKKLHKPLGIVCGDMSLSQNELDIIYPSVIKKITTDCLSKKESMENAYMHLTNRAEELIKEFMMAE